MGHFESRLVDIAQADNPFVTEAARHVLVAGGKRLRPLLVIEINPIFIKYGSYSEL